MIVLLARLLALGNLLAIMVLTLGPIEWRGLSPASTQTDRPLAFAVLAFFSCIAFPRRALVVAMCLAGLIVGLEFAQNLTSYRHANYEHAAQKAFGAVVGFCLGYIVVELIRPKAKRRR